MPAALRERLARLPRVPSFSIVTGDRAAAGDLAYPAFDVVAAADRATGEFVVFASPGDRLLPHALLAAAERITTAPETDLVYSDEAFANGRAFHKPDWSPELLLAQPYVLRFAAYRRTVLDSIGGIDAQAGAAWEYDLALRATAAARRIEHITEVLCRTNEARVLDDSDRLAVAAAARRRGLQATVTLCPHAPVLSLSLEPRERPPVVVIVPTRDRVDMLRRCIDSVLQRTTYPAFSVLVVDNGSVEPATLAQLRAWQADPRVRVMPDPSPFDYAALMNRAVQATDAPLVAFLNNDTEVISPRWLDEMVGWIEQPGVGAVGAKLYFENGTVQHAGVVLGIGGVATHGHKGAPHDAPGYHGLLHCVRDTSAVTGACMLTRRSAFAQIGGFDGRFRVAYNDVDYCLRLRQHGYRILFAPLAELWHLEGASRGDDRRGTRRFDDEIRLMQERWGALLTSDPFYNRNLSLAATDYRLR